MAPFDAAKNAYAITRQDVDADIDVSFDRALQICSRLGGAAPMAGA